MSELQTIETKLDSVVGGLSDLVAALTAQATSTPIAAPAPVAGIPAAPAAPSAAPAPVAGIPAAPAAPIAAPAPVAGIPATTPVPTPNAIGLGILVQLAPPADYPGDPTKFGIVVGQVAAEPAVNAQGEITGYGAPRSQVAWLGDLSTIPEDVLTSL